MYRLVFFGTSDFSTPSLEALLKDSRFQVIAAVTKPDAPIGRHQVLTPPPIKVLAQEYGIPVFQFEKIKTDESFKALEALGEVDAYVVVSYGKIIPQRILDLPKHGCINVHGSLLPRWRGASCLQAAIAAGDEKSGITIMLMDAEMDHGDILAQKAVDIAPDETGGELHDRLARLGADSLPDVLISYLDGELKPQPQDHLKATFCKLLKRDDGKIDRSRPAIEIERLIRAYTPWPGTWTEWYGKRIKILKAKLTVDDERLDTAAKEGQPNIQDDKIYKLCGDGQSLEILELQPAGKKPMTAQEYLIGLHQKK